MLTREELLTMFGVQNGTRLSEWPFEIPPEMVRHIIDTDAALRAERDRLAQRVSDLEHDFKDAASYGELVTDERDKFIQAVGLASTCAGDMIIDVEHPVEMMQEVCTRFHALQAQVAALTKERDNWHSIVKDECDEDECFRKEAGPLDHSDSYGVETHTDILARAKAQLAQRDAQLAQRDARVATRCQPYLTDKGQS